MEASEIRPRLRLVREVRPRSKAADSKSTQVVSSVTSLFSPPITPASATARSGVAMTVMSLVSSRSSPSRVVRRSPSAAARTTIWAHPSALATFAKSKACSGWPYRYRM